MILYSEMPDTRQKNGRKEGRHVQSKIFSNTFPLRTFSVDFDYSNCTIFHIIDLVLAPTIYTSRTQWICCFTDFRSRIWPSDFAYIPPTELYCGEEKFAEWRINKIFGKQILCGHFSRRVLDLFWKLACHLFCYITKGLVLTFESRAFILICIQKLIQFFRICDWSFE